MNYNLSMTPSTIKSKRARLILTYTILNDFSVGGPYCASIMLLDTLKKTLNITTENALDQCVDRTNVRYSVH